MVNTPVEESYGYIEYIHTLPENPIDYLALGKKYIIESASNRASNQVLPKLFKERYKDFLIANMENIECDFIARDDAELARYSYQAGYYAGIASILGMNDFHSGNCIISRRKLVMIDLQCVAQSTQVLTNSIFCQTGSSPLKKLACTLIPLLYLFDVKNGIRNEQILAPSKSCIYSHSMLSQGMFIDYEPEAVQFLNGFTHFLQSIQQNPDDFNRWLELVKTLNPLIRTLPNATSSFIEQFRSYRNSFYNEVCVNDIIANSLEAFCTDASKRGCAIFAEPSVLRELSRFVVPSFFIPMNGYDIVNGVGTNIQITPQVFENLYSNHSRELPLPLTAEIQHYQNNTPYEFLYNAIQQVIQDNMFHEGLIAEAQQLAATFAPALVPKAPQPVVQLQPLVPDNNYGGHDRASCHLPGCTFS